LSSQDILFKLFPIHGFSKVVSLGIIASEVFEEFNLFPGLNPFSYSFEAEGLCKEDRCLNYLNIIPVVGEVLNELPINFKGIDGQFL